jgi:magnesium-transporting ATPase (P-type)
MSVDVTEPLRLLLRDLRCDAGGLSSREAARRLVASGPNALRAAPRRRASADLAEQLVHPLALLLWAAALLAVISGAEVMAVAIVLVMVLNGVSLSSRRGTPNVRR